MFELLALPSATPPPPPPQKTSCDFIWDNHRPEVARVNDWTCFKFRYSVQTSPFVLKSTTLADPRSSLHRRPPPPGTPGHPVF